MNHDFIAAHDVSARYVADRLAPEEERDFEAHLIDCAQCTDEVEQELAPMRVLARQLLTF